MAISLRNVISLAFASVAALASVLAMAVKWSTSEGNVCFKYYQPLPLCNWYNLASSATGKSSATMYVARLLPETPFIISPRPNMPPQIIGPAQETRTGPVFTNSSSRGWSYFQFIPNIIEPAPIGKRKARPNQRELRWSRYPPPRKKKKKKFNVSTLVWRKSVTPVKDLRVWNFEC